MSFTTSRAASARRLFGKARAGFTVIEVALAATVLALVISTSLIVMQSGFRSLDTARKTTLAAQIIQSEMERIRMLSWTRMEQLMHDSKDIDLSTIFPSNTAVEKKILDQMNEAFTATRTITALTDYSSEVLEITVTVTWKGIDGVTHNRSTNTRYCKNGLYNYYCTIASS